MPKDEVLQHYYAETLASKSPVLRHGMCDTHGLVQTEGRQHQWAGMALLPCLYVSHTSTRSSMKHPAKQGPVLI